MKNPRTTIAGYLIIAAVVLQIAAKLLTGEGVDSIQVNHLVEALIGAGFVAARDGGK